MRNKLLESVVNDNNLSKDEKLMLLKFMLINEQERVLMTAAYALRAMEKLPVVSQYLVGASLATTIAKLAYRIFRDNFTEAGKRCVNFKEGIEKKVCLQDAKTKLLQDEINLLKSNSRYCNQNPDKDKARKCLEKINETIEKKQEKLRGQIDKLKKLKLQLAEKIKRQQEAAEAAKKLVA